MALFERLRWAALLATLSVIATCVPLVDEDNRPCPCAGAYSCCPTTQTCLLPSEQCPSASTAGAAGATGGSAGAATTGGHISAGAATEGAASGGISGGGSSAGGAMSVSGEAGAAGDTSGHSAGAGGEGGCPATRGACSAYARTSNVLLLIYNPLLKSGQSLRSFLAAPDARAVSAELAQRLRAASGGRLSYHIVEARELAAWPPQRPGTMPLDETSFMGGVYDNGYVSYVGDNVAEGALNADYGAIFAEQHVCDVVQAKDISEVWLWGAHNGEMNFGFEYFSYRLAKDALGAAATPADRALYAQRRRNLPDCGRTLWLLGAQYSEGLDSVGKAHRSYNFRTQELLELALRTVGHDTAVSQATWARFSQYELGPGDGAQVGTPVFPPNAGVGIGAGDQATAWDYSNLSQVFSGADQWFGYPALSGAPRQLDCTAWGCSNEGFQSWYSLHVPHADGASADGTCNNWWKYVADPDDTLKACCGAECDPGAALGLPCASDSDCASGHCACADAAVCVEQAVAPCGRPNWSLCQTDSDCGSGVCGCNGGPPPKYCLPSEAYARSCSN